MSIKDLTKADKKLEKLGFIKNTSECYGEDKGVLIYEKNMGNDIFHIEFRNKKVFYANLEMRCLWIEKSLLKAILEKLEEFEVAEIKEAQNAR